MQSVPCPSDMSIHVINNAGPDPMRALTDICRLRLFPAVFTVASDAEAKLPSNWGEPCVHLMSAATATLKAVKFQVGHSIPACHQPCLLPLVTAYAHAVSGSMSEPRLVAASIAMIAAVWVGATISPLHDKKN